ncbi:protein N-lysine methyltransferase METTL21A-like [Branchiostoma lanceolatum]|uniref:protein N-lysine methyltransferase METTL21A-like n=1 Tax=Branchiostoma lanceolatum TaxID=7740 RepID=UPI003451F46A
MDTEEEWRGEGMERHFWPPMFLDPSYRWEEYRVGRGVKVRLLAVQDGGEGKTASCLTGQMVWPAARVLSQHIVDHPELVQARTVLELGAGTGLLGLVAAKLSPCPKKVVLTDNNMTTLDMMEANVEENFPIQTTMPPRCAHLHWGENLNKFLHDHGKFDVILGADVILWKQYIRPLFETVKKLLSQTDTATFLLCYQCRYAELKDKVYEAAKEVHLVGEEIQLEENAAFVEQEDKAKDNLHLIKFCHQFVNVCETNAVCSTS